jgi:hypothetical protein
MEEKEMIGKKKQGIKDEGADMKVEALQTTVNNICAVERCTIGRPSEEALTHFCEM